MATRRNKSATGKRQIWLTKEVQIYTSFSKHENTEETSMSATAGCILKYSNICIVHNFRSRNINIYIYIYILYATKVQIENIFLLMINAS